MTTVLELPERIAALPAAARARAEGIFAVDVASGQTDPPPEMLAWLEAHFGSLGAVREQRITRVTNRWTLDGALFSPLRSRRPQDGAREDGAMEDGAEDGRSQPDDARQDNAGAVQPADSAATDHSDPFCHPETATPAAPWGRVESAYAVSGANAAMYDGQHGVLVFRRHDPLAFDEAAVADLLNLGRRWADAAHAADPLATNYLLIWNCGRRAGGSIVHGHAQVLLGRGAHYPQVERLRRDAGRYRDATGRAYLADLVAVHRDLGLVIAERDEVATLASIAPVKERELLVIGPPGMDEREPAFATAVARAVVAYRDVLGVRAFNLALHRPPIAPQPATDGWQQIGPVIHLVDRGDPASSSSDIGAMELYAAAVVGGDPFDLADRLREVLGPRN